MRIQHLESELDSACETKRSRKRRGGSAPPCPVLVAKEAAGDAMQQTAPGEQDQQPPDSFASPRHAAPSSEDSPCIPVLPGLRPLSAESGSAELWAVCEAMQLQQRETLQLIRDACHCCGVIPPVGVAFEDAKALLDALCAAHPGASHDFSEDAPHTPPQHHRRSLGEVQSCKQLEALVQQLQEQLHESEQQRIALQATLESTNRAGNCSQQAELCSVAAQTIALESNNLLGANAGTGHFDSNLSMLSVSISPHGEMPSSPVLSGSGRSIAGVDIGHQRHPFAEALAMLRQLVEDGAAKAAPGTNLAAPCCQQALANLSLAERLDLLDLAAAVRSAEPLLVEAAAASAGTSRQVNSAEHGLSRTSLASSMASMSSLPAAGRLTELADDKLREVMELQVRCDGAQSSEARLEAATLLAAAREELRLLREYAGLEPLGVTDLPSIAASG